MRKRLFLTALTVVLACGGAPVATAGENLESFISRSQQFWNEGLAEFVEDSREHLKGVDVEPVVAGKLKTFTEIAESYQIPAEELEKAYSLAVERAAEKSMERLKEKLTEERNLSDADVAFLMGSLTRFLRFHYGSFVRNYAESISEEELKSALESCLSLRMSPMVRAFLKSGECRELLKEFPADVERTVFRGMGKRERELLSSPSLTDRPTLRYILENLKRFGLAGG